MNTIPVIILNWNGLTDTLECVESVLNQSHIDFHIYLIDNNSSVLEKKELSRLFNANENISLIFNDSNIGFGNAHNVIFKQLKNKYKYIALINNDAVAHINWLQNALDSVLKNNADIIACKMLQFCNTNLIDSAGLVMLNSGEIIPRGNGEIERKFNTPNQVVSFCAGACLIKSSLFEDVGYFDEYFDTGYEDAELGLRATLAGKKITYDPSSIVYHKMSQTLNKVINKKRTLKIQKDVNYTYLKNLPFSIILFNLPFYIIRSTILIILHFVTFRFSYIKIYFAAITSTLFKDLSQIIKNRRSVKISLIELSRFIKISLIYDIKRFHKYIINRTPHKFEQTKSK